MLLAIAIAIAIAIVAVVTMPGTFGARPARRPMTDGMRLVGLVLIEVSVVFGLHVLGRLDEFAVDWSDPVGWLEEAAFDDAAGAVVLLTALALAYWLLASTVAWVVASGSGRPGLLRVVERLTMPPVRRLAGRTMALTLAATTVSAPIVPVVANQTGGERVVVEIGPEGQLVPPGTSWPGEGGDGELVLPPHLGPVPEPGAAAPAAAPEEAPSGAEYRIGAASHTVVVRRGDHMWSLSEEHLERVTGRTDLGDHEIARYWIKVIEENRSRIRSGDPDLIYPGETLVLPPV